jgi:hypothetical protein
MVIPPFPVVGCWLGSSVGGHVDADRNAASDYVVDGGPVHGLLHQLTQLGGRRVPVYPEADPDLAEPVADLVRQPEARLQRYVREQPRGIGRRY